MTWNRWIELPVCKVVLNTNCLVKPFFTYVIYVSIPNLICTIRLVKKTKCFAIDLAEKERDRDRERQRKRERERGEREREREREREHLRNGEIKRGRTSEEWSV